MKFNTLFISAILPGLSLNALANEADVVEVTARCHEECTFYVTVKHHDQGWDHFVNKWEILTPDGKVIATRKLQHPHVHEQPFTRSLSHVVIPTGVKSVTIRAYDSVHGYGGREYELALPQ